MMSLRFRCAFLRLLCLWVYHVKVLPSQKAANNNIQASCQLPRCITNTTAAISSLIQLLSSILNDASTPIVQAR